MTQGNSSNQQSSRDLIKGALVRINELESELETLESQKNEPIAIVGMGCRLPGSVVDSESLWNLLIQGTSGISEVPADRWDINALYDADIDAPGKMNTRYGGFVKNVADFDPEFFGISPREAASMDPQQRLLLEVTWEALENANIDPRNLYGTSAGVFIGIIAYDYGQRLLGINGLEKIDAYSGTGSSLGVAAGRISYTLGLTGPSLSLDTACSSSLVSIHLACESLRRRECNLAMAGGVNLMLEPGLSVNFSKAHMLSSDGKCKTFDASANGYVRGEGCGIVVLKRLGDAIKNNDPILALIRGSAVNQDGASGGLTVPSGPSQSSVIRQALKNAKITPNDVGYIEAHGTGTSLGDPIELGSMADVFSHGRDMTDPLWIGSIKTNIGHLEAAAGIAGIMKLILALRNEKIPAHLNCETPTARFAWSENPIRVAQTTKSWPRSDKPRIAGISSFGFSGTNAHILLEEAPVSNSLDNTGHQSDSGNTQILNFSAQSQQALITLAKSYSSLLKANQNLDLYQLCANASQSRAHLKYRLSVLGSTPGEIAENLDQFTLGESGPNIVQSSVNEASMSDIAFLFTGQGSQYPGMGKLLYETEDEFKKWIDACASILELHCDISLTDLLFESDASILNQSIYTQPALFCLEYSLAKLWHSFNVQPHVLVGHSLGEYVAACIAGVFTLEDAIGMVATRAKLMHALPKDGSMVAVSMPYEKLSVLLQPHTKEVAIAAINGKERCVISGKKDAIELILKELQSENIAVSTLPVSHAFHSPLMQPMIAAFGEYLNNITFNTPRIPIISNLTGQYADDSICTKEYWLNHILEPVQFSRSVNLLKDKKIGACIEIGPSPVLCSLAREALSDTLLLPSLKQNQSDTWQILQSLGKLNTHHYPIDWQQIYPRSKVHHLALPNYPFQRDRYWIERKSSNYKSVQHSSRNHPLLGSVLRVPGLPGNQKRYSQCLDPDLTYLSEHQVFGRPILPATAYIELAIAAIIKQDGHYPIEITNFELTQPIAITNDMENHIQIVINQDSGKSEFNIYSCTQSAGEESVDWTNNAHGHITQHTLNTPETLNIAQLRSKLNESVPVHEFYEQCELIGIKYGPSYRLVRNLWRLNNQALAEIDLSCGPIVANLDQYHVYPCQLDACFQILFSVLPYQEKDEIWLPIGLEKLTLFKSFHSKVFCFVELKGNADDAIQTADVQVLNDTGELLCSIEGLTARKTSLSAWRKGSIERKQIDSLLYDIEWQASPLPEEIQNSQAVHSPKSWIIFADEAGLSPYIQKLCDEAHIDYRIIKRGNQFSNSDGNTYTINPFSSDNFLALFNQLSEIEIDRCLYFWTLDLPIGLNAGTAATEQMELSWKSPLFLVQALKKHRLSSEFSLDFITLSSLPVTQQSSLNLLTAPVIGFAKSVQAEMPEWKCRVIDLEAESLEANYKVNAALILSECLQSKERSFEDQVAYRNLQRYVSRLKRCAPLKPLPQAPAYHLTIPASGSLEDLAWIPCERAEPQAGEVEIEVHTAGMNFKDVLLALHRVPAIDNGLGVECAGRVVKLGPGVTEFTMGQRVLAMVPGCLSRFICAPAQTTVALPDSLEDHAAATIPITFLTAAYSLENLAKIRPGERVLIHAATGGVGQAAIQIARAAGAIVYATASRGKWQILKDLGVQYIFDSRTTEFEQSIRELTNNEGVDVVLNSLRGEFTDASLRLLKSGGRFLEIGITDLRSSEEIARWSTQIEYFPIDLMVIYRENREILQTLLHKLLQRFAAGEFKPLPYQSYPASTIENAFRTMQQAKHVGKVVIDMHQDKLIDDGENSQYMILGGLGDLGLKLTDWLIENNAKNIVLIGRNAPSIEKQNHLNALQESGINIEIIQADMTSSSDVEHAFEILHRFGKTLKGIFHCAAVLDDGTIESQSEEQFRQVLSAKIDSAWLIHEKTQNIPLDFLMLYSSATSILGAPGQANYVAANAFFDALAHYRHAMNQATYSINWGAWAEVGMAHRMSSQANLAKQGIRAISPELALASMATSVQYQKPQIGILDIDWPTYLKNKNQSAFLTDFQDERQGSDHQVRISSFLDDFSKSSDKERDELIHHYVERNVVAVLNLSKSKKIDRTQGFLDMGMDSLTAVELRNRLTQELMAPLPATLIFDYPNINKLSKYILQILSDRYPLSEMSSTVDTDLKHQLVDQLSEQEAAEELLKTLKDMGFST